MAGEEGSATASAAQRKTCRTCGEAKAPSEFYPRHRRCKPCAIAQAAIRNKAVSAETKRLYKQRFRRKKGCRLRAEMAAETARKRAERDALRKPRAEPKPQRGSKAWYLTASSEEVAAYRAAIREHSKKRYVQNAAEERARVRRYKLANPRPGSARWFAMASPEEVAASGLKPYVMPVSAAGKVDNKVRRARLVANQRDGTLTPGAIKKMMAAASVCPYCRKKMADDQKSLDHITPLSRGGLHSRTNALICCRECNSHKRDRLPEAWAASLPVAVYNSAIRAMRAATGAPLGQAALLLPPVSRPGPPPG